MAENTSPPEPLRIKDAFGVYVRGPDDVELRSGATSGRTVAVSDPERRGLLAQVIARLGAPPSAPQRPWNAAESELLAELVPELRDSGVLESDEPAAPGAEPGLAFPLLAKPMAQARIGLLGHGVLGRAVAGLLRAVPCGRIDVIASASVADANATGFDASMRRPQSDAEWIEALRGRDWTIAAQDCFEPEELAALNRAALELRQPWSLVCLDGFEGWVGPTFVPGQTACFACFRQRLFAGAAEPKHVFADPGVKVHRMPSPASAGAETAPWVSLIASMFALDVIAAMDGRGFTFHHMLIVHRLNLTFQRERVLRLPRCEVCSPRRGAPQPNVFANLLATRTPDAEP